MQLQDFDYELPAEAIAQVPVEPRDASRLLVAGETLVDTTFDRLVDFLQPGDLLVRNATRVRAARLKGTRPTGGGVELLLLSGAGPEWDALARPARKLRPGMRLDFESLTGEVVDVEGEGRVRVRLATADDIPIEDLIAAVGTVPFPPYITTGPSDPDRYQTVYASRVGSAAAPTAGLHFTEDLLAALAGRGVGFADVLLDIGLDTFRPIAVSAVEEHRMHEERYEIPAETVSAIEEAKHGGGRVIAVGTTVVRALESAASGGSLAVGAGSTDLFIRPGYRVRMVDALLTNFHMPRSSLIVMLAALLPDWRRVYAHALAGGYRFLSFGDAMFVPSIPAGEGEV
ncbi:MAG: tRNA preQ1(34) S-adenosylmethionine ribosyltransferase-isomerase QueA [Acidimicrobiia bacterium]|nr:tRNA preQ1(34) S-adenosylmethionine ribosyltransferase-isomerase QueA [Acidimicrobiia bacterium]